MPICSPSSRAEGFPALGPCRARRRNHEGVERVCQSRSGTIRVAPQLKLIALDADDLAVISAHVQDARLQACDIVWRQSEKRLVIGMNRLDWEQTLDGEAEPRRLIAALRF